MWKFDHPQGIFQPLYSELKNLWVLPSSQVLIRKCNPNTVQLEDPLYLLVLFLAVFFTHPLLQCSRHKLLGILYVNHCINLRIYPSHFLSLFTALHHTQHKFMGHLAILKVIWILSAHLQEILIRICYLYYNLLSLRLNHLVLPAIHLAFYLRIA